MRWPLYRTFPGAGAGVLSLLVLSSPSVPGSCPMRQYRQSQSFREHSGVHVDTLMGCSIHLVGDVLGCALWVCNQESLGAASVLVAGMWGAVGSGTLPPGQFCPDVCRHCIVS